MTWGRRKTLAIQGTTSHFAPQRTRRVSPAWPHRRLTPVSASQHALRAAFVDEISVCVADTRVASPRSARLCMTAVEAHAVTEGNHCMFVGALPVSISSRLLSALRDILAETWSYTQLIPSFRNYRSPLSKGSIQITEAGLPPIRSGEPDSFKSSTRRQAAAPSVWSIFSGPASRRSRHLWRSSPCHLCHRSSSRSRLGGTSQRPEPAASPVPAAHRRTPQLR